VFFKVREWISYLVTVLNLIISNEWKRQDAQSFVVDADGEITVVDKLVHREHCVIRLKRR
jgi:hypothetical protein